MQMLKILFTALHGAMIGCLVATPALAQALPWTLESSIARALQHAPELRASAAEIAARSGDIVQASAWPNPTVELRADEKLGIADGRGGYTVNQATITQAIPLGRLAHQRRAAEANLDAAREEQRYQRLQIEARVAQAFHTLQLTQARQQLAQERLTFATGLDQSKGALVRYLSPLERARLDILRESARQEVAHAEGTWSEALAQFRALLTLPPEAQPETVLLVAAEAPAALSALSERLTNHPALRATQQLRDASQAGIEVARAQRYADPTISIFHERDNLANSRQNYSGIMLGVHLPLWNQGDGGVARARAEADKVGAQLAVQQRDLDSRLRQSHLHLGHLIEQAEHYRTHLLVPARQVLTLTRKAYTSGEQSGLALVDANNTYFEAQERYLSLLHEGWMEAAELRLAAGISLIDNMEIQP
jgi:cobalt-zinc-cadmium efflux system outer membrane protein